MSEKNDVDWISLSFVRRRERIAIRFVRRREIRLNQPRSEGVDCFREVTFGLIRRVDDCAECVGTRVRLREDSRDAHREVAEAARERTSAQLQFRIDVEI